MESPTAPAEVSSKTARPPRACFASDRRGISAIEFAVLLPAFLGLVYMVAQIGLYFYFSSRLIYATNKAVRAIMTGAAANQNMTAAQFRTSICANLPSNMSCNNIITNVQVVPDTSSGASYWYNLTNYAVNPSSPLGYTVSALIAPPMDNSKTAFCIGSPGSYIALQVYYAMPVLGIPQMLSGSTYNGQSVVFISTTSVFKNEPFSTSYSGC